MAFTDKHAPKNHHANHVSGIEGQGEKPQGVRSHSDHLKPKDTHSADIAAKAENPSHIGR